MTVRSLGFPSCEKITHKHIDDYIDLIVKEGGISTSELEEFKNHCKMFFLKKPCRKKMYFGQQSKLILVWCCVDCRCRITSGKYTVESFAPAKFTEVFKIRRDETVVLHGVTERLQTMGKCTSKSAFSQ